MPAARRTDPSSSHAAASYVAAAGIASEQQRRALAAVKALPGRTSAELAREQGLDRYMLARRLPELLKDGAVIRRDPRPDIYTGRPSVTWWPANSTQE
jgi:DNA-binding MarR family transcriptional regulator